VTARPREAAELPVGESVASGALEHGSGAARVGEAPYPLHFPKMPGAACVQPSKAPRGLVGAFLDHGDIRVVGVERARELPSRSIQ
jgi:hypothetical protein